MPLAEHDRRRLHQVQGLITLAESERLAELASETPAWASIVEVGSHTGRSTVWLAAGARSGKNPHITAIDPFPDSGYDPNDDPFDLVDGDAVLARFVANLTAEQAWGRVTVLRATSLAVAKRWVNPIGLLFIDALHTYLDVRADCEAWLHHVTSGGYVAFHDWFDDPSLTHLSEVAEAVADAWTPDEWDVQPMSENLFVARRR